MCIYALFLHNRTSVYTFALSKWVCTVKYCKALFEVPHHKNYTPRPCNIPLPRTQTQRAHSHTHRKTNGTPALTPHPFAWGVFDSCSSSGCAIDLSVLFLTSQHVCLRVCLFWLLSSTTSPRRPFNEPLYLPSADSLPHCLPCSVRHSHTHTHTPVLLQGCTTVACKPCVPINARTCFGCSPVQRGTGSCERALGLSRAAGKRRHSAFHLSLSLSFSHAPPHSHSASPSLFISVFLSPSHTPSIYLSLHFHINCRNTAEIWALHHRWSGGLRMAERERNRLREPKTAHLPSMPTRAS